MSAANRVITGAAVATVVVLAGVAGAISYSHMAELARLHGEVGWRARAFPVSVDGIEIVASLVPHRSPGPGPVADGPGSEAVGPGPRQPVDDAVPVELEDAARSVRDQLISSGTAVNRRTLATGLRAAGHRVRNDRLGHLLRVATAEDASTPLPVRAVGGGRDD